MGRALHRRLDDGDGALGEVSTYLADTIETDGGGARSGTWGCAPGRKASECMLEREEEVHVMAFARRVDAVRMALVRTHGGTQGWVRAEHVHMLPPHARGDAAPRPFAVPGAFRSARNGPPGATGKGVGKDDFWVGRQDTLRLPGGPSLRPSPYIQTRPVHSLPVFDSRMGLGCAGRSHTSCQPRRTRAKCVRRV